MAITKINTPELFDFSATNTALQLPTGDTASRPTSPSTGEWRFNSELKYVEYYDGADWFQIDTESNAPVGSENFNVNTYFGNGATQAIDAKFNEAANFNGSSSKIVTSSKILDNKTNLTISLWIKDLGNANYTGIIAEGGNSGEAGYVLAAYPDNTTLEFWRSSGDNVNYVFVGGSYNFGLGNYWTHIAITVTPSEVKYYKNGVNVKTTSITNTSTVSSAYNTTLMYDAQYNKYNSGTLDQVRIYDTALDQAAVTALQLETTTTASSLSFPSGETAIATYQLDGNGDDISTNYNGTTTDIGYTGLKFQPDFTWIKRRYGIENHYLQDSVRGSTQQIYSNLPNGQFNETTAVTSFSANGFNIGSYNGINNSGETYVAWNWKAGGAPTATNSAGAGNVPTSGSVMIDGVASTAALAGTIAATSISANTAAGFSIVQYTGTGSLATVGHGLNQPVELILVKNTSASASWAVYSAPTGINKFLELNSSGAATSYSNYWGAATPTNDVFGVVNGNFNNNAINASLIAYCFHSVAGYSKIGSYTGSGTTLQTITTGFEPAFIMFKNTDAGNVWTIMDNKRNTTNPRNLGLFPNLPNAEYTYPGTPNGLSFTSTGFTLDTGQAEFNQNILEYIYMAFAAT